jgi:hypothetical protein
VTTDETLGTVHSNASHRALTQMLLCTSASCSTQAHISRISTYSNLKHQSLAIVVGLDGVEDGWEGIGGELHCAGVSSAYLSGSSMKLLPSTTAPMT